VKCCVVQIMGSPLPASVPVGCNLHGECTGYTDSANGRSAAHLSAKPSSADSCAADQLAVRTTLDIIGSSSNLQHSWGTRHC
jgi:hypothetical protein